LSKVSEKNVYAQLLSFVDSNNILRKSQSGFRAGHSTESVPLKVFNDLLWSLEGGKCAILILLDLSAAFDSVDHHIRQNGLKDQVGIQNTVLQSFTSYPTGRTFSVENGYLCSSAAPVRSGIP